MADNQFLRKLDIQQNSVIQISLNETVNYNDL